MGVVVLIIKHPQLVIEIYLASDINLHRQSNVLKFFSCLVTLPTYSLKLLSSVVSLEVIATDGRMKRTVNLSKIIDFSGFEFCWECMR